MADTGSGGGVALLAPHPVSVGGAAASRGSAVATAEGIKVYPPQRPGDRWRAVWYEPDGKRGQCQAVTEGRLAARLEPVAERLAAGAPNLLRTGRELIAYYLSADRLPAERQWSRKHAETQRYLCARFLAPVIGNLSCQDIRRHHMQAAVNAAPTAGEGRRVRSMVSALVGAGITGGYLTDASLKDVHWQAHGRPAARPRGQVAGESALYVDPGEIPAPGDVAGLGRAAGAHGWRYELMVNFAAYSGLRWGELAALTVAQIGQAQRLVTVDRKLVEVRGHLFVEAPKNRKRRRTIYPRRTPGGYPLAGQVTRRAAEVTAEQATGRNPDGIVFPSPRGTYWRSSNFNRRILGGAYRAAGWRDEAGASWWTWHSLRHVFCSTALSVWHLEPADVSRLAGHANVRITLDMYVGAVAGALDRARRATD